jgi:glucose/arabinose dehydrogenase
LNYGWPVVTHGRQYGSGAQIGEGTAKPGMEAPIHTWGPTSPATSGLAIYRGDAFPAWRGDLLVGMLREGAIRRVTIRDGRVTGEQKLAEGTASRIRDVRVGPDGYVYFISDSRDGVLARLVPAR